MVFPGKDGRNFLDTKESGPIILAKAKYFYDKLQTAETKFSSAWFTMV